MVPSSTPTATPSRTAHPLATPTRTSSHSWRLMQTPAVSTERIGTVPSCVKRYVLFYFGTIAPFSKWVRRSMGLTWRPGSTTRRLDRAGSGRMCFRFMPKLKESFFVIAVTRASHGRDHNNCRISCHKHHEEDGCLSGDGLGVVCGWFKAYQTVRKNKGGYGIYSVDFTQSIIILIGSTQKCSTKLPKAVFHLNEALGHLVEHVWQDEAPCSQYLSWG